MLSESEKIYTKNMLQRCISRYSRTSLVIATLVIWSISAAAQSTSPSCWWIKLSDKKGSNYQLSNPEMFLSERAISRRIRQHIPIDETDLPVSAVYSDSLKKMGLELIHSSKWLNGLTVKVNDTTVMRKVRALTFVTSVQLTKPALLLKSANQKFNEEEFSAEYKPANYGTAINQLTQLKGDYLHQQGFRGKGIQIAVLDAGFWKVDKLMAFDSLRTSGRILGKRDFVDPKSDFYAQHTHGMSVLSCMGANLPGTIIGTSPDASFYLFRTEDAPTEYLIEEDNWVAAAEFADSLGVDVINSSLGYYTFDDSKMDHPFSDLNGVKTRVTQGANMAFQKGILVFASAGNEGNNSWKRIIAPSDGANVIAVAAVDKIGIRASFSSVGPAFGGAVKPNVAALGASTYLLTSGEVFGFSSGTSFSSPVLAGMGACLLQANPYANAKQVKMAIEQSAHQYNKPDSLLGFGIPNFEKADKYLKVNSAEVRMNEKFWTVSPNPFNDYLVVHDFNPELDQTGKIRIYNLQGICMLETTFRSAETFILRKLNNLSAGIYFLNVESGDKKQQFKLVKTDR